MKQTAINRRAVLFGFLSMLGCGALAFVGSSAIGDALTIGLLIVATGGLVYWLIARQGEDQGRTRQALLQHQAHFGEIISSAMDAIISVDAEQQIILFNSAA